MVNRPRLHACKCRQQHALSFSLKGKLLFSRTLSQLPTLTKSYAMFPNISQAPALLTSLHRVVREREAQGAVTLNDSMNRPQPLRAHCLAVSCFDMGPNTSLTLGQRVWVQSPVHEEENCSIWLLTACRDKSGAFLPRWEGMVVACGSHRARWMDVSHCCLSPISPSDHLFVCLLYCLSLCLSGSYCSE